MASLTSEERDRLTLAAIEKRISEKEDEIRRIAVMMEQADRLMTQAEEMVVNLIIKLERFSIVDSESTTRPVCLKERGEGDFYGCKDVYAKLKDQIDHLNESVLTLDLMEQNPLSCHGGFRDESRHLKCRLEQFVDRIAIWSRNSFRMIIQ